MKFLSNHTIHTIFIMTLCGIYTNTLSMGCMSICTKKVPRQSTSSAKVAPAPDDKSKTEMQAKATAALASAIRRANYVDAARALANNANPDALSFKNTSFGESMLVLAIRSRNKDIIQLLLDSKADLNPTRYLHEFNRVDRLSPLMEAAGTTPEIFELLVARKADVTHETYWDERNILHILASYYSCNFSDKDRLACMLSVMEKPELHDSDIRLAYKYTEGEMWQSSKANMRAMQFLNDARYEKEKFRIVAILNNILPLIPDLHNIVAGYLITITPWESLPKDRTVKANSHGQL
ncbi:MAG: ankyrin repeat domain-containing protein [Candidatus Babeliales bacterium]